MTTTQITTALTALTNYQESCRQNATKCRSNHQSDKFWTDRLEKACDSYRALLDLGASS